MIILAIYLKYFRRKYKKSYSYEYFLTGRSTSFSYNKLESKTKPTAPSCQSCRYTAIPPVNVPRIHRFAYQTETIIFSLLYINAMPFIPNMIFKSIPIALPLFGLTGFIVSLVA